MSKIKTLYKNINVLNILLTITIVLFVLYSVLPSLDADIEYIPPASGEGSAEAQDKGRELYFKKPVFQSDYIIIAERNLFHPERRMPDPVKEEAVVDKPDFVLYGTMVIGDVKIAYMEDKKSPISTPGRGKRQKAVRKGDKLSGYTLDDVYQDRVLMVKDDDSIEVYIIDPSTPKERKEVGAAAEKPKETPKAKARRELRTRKKR